MRTWYGVRWKGKTKEKQRGNRGRGGGNRGRGGGNRGRGEGGEEGEGGGGGGGRGEGGNGKDEHTLVASQLFIHFVDQNGAVVSRERKEAVLVEGLREELLS